MICRLARKRDNNQEEEYVDLAGGYDTRDGGQSIQVRHGRGHPREVHRWPPTVSRQEERPQSRYQRGCQAAGGSNRLLGGALRRLVQQADPAPQQQQALQEERQNDAARGQEQRKIAMEPMPDITLKSFANGASRWSDVEVSNSDCFADDLSNSDNWPEREEHRRTVWR